MAKEKTLPIGKILFVINLTISNKNIIKFLDHYLTLWIFLAITVRYRIREIAKTHVKRMGLSLIWAFSAIGLNISGKFLKSELRLLK